MTFANSRSARGDAACLCAQSEPKQRDRRPARSLCYAVLAGVALSALASAASGELIKAAANNKHHINNQSQVFSRQDDASYTVGQTRAGSKNKPAHLGKYKDGAFGHSATDQKSNSFGLTSADASSGIGPFGTGQNGFNDYMGSVLARVLPENDKCPGMSAVAHVADPQYLDPAGLLLEPILIMEITFHEGTGVFCDTLLGEATLYCDDSSSLFGMPIWSLGASMVLTPVLDVWFNPDPALSFSMTEAELISALTAASFFSPDGLTTDVVFTYYLDTTGYSITEDDWLGSVASAEARFVPQPSAVCLFVAAGCGARRRHRR